MIIIRLLHNLFHPIVPYLLHSFALGIVSTQMTRKE